MRITEGKLRSIIRSVIRESLEGDMKISSMSRGDFNKAYGDIMLKTGSDHFEVSEEYTHNHDHYDDFEYGLTIVGKPYTKRTIFEALGLIGCKTPSGSEYKKWLENNASKIIECLEKADPETKKTFFDKIESALYH